MAGMKPVDKKKLFGILKIEAKTLSATLTTRKKIASRPYADKVSSRKGTRERPAKGCGIPVKAPETVWSQQQPCLQYQKES